MINAFIVIVYITLYSSIICFQNCYLLWIQASFLFTTAISINCQGQSATPTETIMGIVLDTISVELPLPDVRQTHQGRQQLTQALWLRQLWCYLPLGWFRHRMHVLYKCALVAANKPQSDSDWFILSCLPIRRYQRLFPFSLFAIGILLIPARISGLKKLFSLYCSVLYSYILPLSTVEKYTCRECSGVAVFTVLGCTSFIQPAIGPA